jgi:outer membrane protein OmpA-like peptidoglycan-associated protein
MAPPPAFRFMPILVVVRKIPGEKPIRVEGHTGNTGSPAYNKQPSRQRAESVK